MAACFSFRARIAAIAASARRWSIALIAWAKSTLTTTDKKAPTDMAVDRNELARALATEIKRLPKWKFPVGHVKTWALSVGPRIEVAARVTPIMNHDGDGVGSYMRVEIADDDTAQSVATKMIDSLLNDPRFEMSTGTPIKTGS